MAKSRKSSRLRSRPIGRRWFFYVSPIKVWKEKSQCQNNRRKQSQHSRHLPSMIFLSTSGGAPDSLTLRYLLVIISFGHGDLSFLLRCFGYSTLTDWDTMSYLFLIVSWNVVFGIFLQNATFANENQQYGVNYRWNFLLDCPCTWEYVLFIVFPAWPYLTSQLNL